MKKILNIVFALLIFICTNISTKAMTYQEGLQESHTKPMLMLVYAQWADDYAACLQNFRELKNTYGDKFNYVELDVASNDAKSFNEKCYIYPNLPYVMLYKNGGTVTRYLQRSYISDTKTLVSKINMFIN